MLAIIPSTVREWVACIAILAIGFALFAVGNLVIGRKTGGKRLVVFSLGAAFEVMGYSILRETFTTDRSTLLLIVGVGFAIVGLALVIVSFASDKTVENAFKGVLRSF